MRFNRAELSLFAAALIYGAVLLTLQGCTAIASHREPPKDWPALTVSVQKVGFWELQDICGSGGARVLLQQYMACAWIRFDNRTCSIYYAAEGEHGELALEHERDHCKGKDHIGMSTLSDAWRDWKNERH